MPFIGPSFTREHRNPYRESAAPPVPPAPRVWRPFILGMLFLSFGISWLLVEPLDPVFTVDSNTDKCMRLVFAVMIFIGARLMRDYGHASASLATWREKYGQRRPLREARIEDIETTPNPCAKCGGECIEFGALAERKNER